jgi:parallel beta-helix repeat protein
MGFWRGTTGDYPHTGDRKCALREAIANVNAAADTTRGDCAAGSGTGDTITFNLTLPATIKLRHRELAIRQDVSIMGPGADLLAIDGHHRTRVFHVTAGSTSISSLTVQNGRDKTPTSRRVGRGGGVVVDSGAALYLADCTLSGNTAISVYLGNGAYGGGINNAGVATLTNCTLSGNSAPNGAGGGINNDGTMTLTNCTLSGNSAPNGAGGGINNDGTMTLIDCTLSGNSAPNGAGGGICNVGIYVGFPGTATLTDCTLSGNSAPNGTGGGIYSFYGTATLTNCTLSGNGAKYGGGIYLSTSFSGFDPLNELLNTIVAVNQPNDCGGDGASRPTSNGHNMDGDGSCFGSRGDDLDSNPQLAPIGNYGGVTQMLALCTGPGVPDSSCTGVSPAINAGDDSVTGSPDNLTTDQRGLPRLSGRHVDIGAYEAQQ